MRLLHGIEDYVANVDLDDPGLLPPEIRGISRSDIREQVARQAQVVIANLLPGEAFTIKRSEDPHAYIQWTLSWASPKPEVEVEA